MNDPHQELFEFVLDKAEQEPTAKRVRLYRALASYAGSPAEARNLRTLADALEKADRSCREFVFNFKQGS